MDPKAYSIPGASPQTVLPRITIQHYIILNKITCLLSVAATSISISVPCPALNKSKKGNGKRNYSNRKKTGYFIQDSYTFMCAV